MRRSILSAYLATVLLVVAWTTGFATGTAAASPGFPPGPPPRPGCKWGFKGWECKASDSDREKDDDRRKGGNDTGGTTGSGGSTGSDGPTAEEIWQGKVDEINDANDEAIERYDDAVDQYKNCVTGNIPEMCHLPAPPALQDRPPLPPDVVDPGPGPTRPVFTPPQAAWIVISTELTIPTPKPGIGPDPRANRWDMAVVGYPYWLWAEGQTEASTEASAGGLHVSLDAHVSGLVFDMGDGNKVKCKGTGTKWSGRGSSSDPAESPTCGYRWKKMSGKNKEYTVTVTTYWEVDWVAGGETGTEYLVTTATRHVPVGELQTVVDG